MKLVIEILMRKLLTLFFISIALAPISAAFAQSNAHTPEQIAEKLRRLEAMTYEKIKEELKHRHKEDLDLMRFDSVSPRSRESIERYIDEVERAQVRSFNEVREEIKQQTGDTRQQMESQLEKAESFWETNIAKIREFLNY